MSRMVGTVSRGVRAPIIRNGDDLASIVTSSILEAARDDGFVIRDRDIIAMTEAIVARAQGNYATTDDIAKDIQAKFPDGTVGVIFPILSRNRFAVCLPRELKRLCLCSHIPQTRLETTLSALMPLMKRELTPIPMFLLLQNTVNFSDTASTALPVLIMWNTLAS